MIPFLTGLISWVMEDKVRSFIFFLVGTCTYIILTFKRDIKEQVQKITDAFDAHLGMLQIYEDSDKERQIEFNKTKIDINGTVMSMNLTLNAFSRDLSNDKSAIIKALLENTAELRKSTHQFSLATEKLMALQKDYKEGYGRILLVDEKLKTLVERNKK